MATNTSDLRYRSTVTAMITSRRTLLTLTAYLCVTPAVWAGSPLDAVTLQVIELEQSPQEFAQVIVVPGAAPAGNTDAVSGVAADPLRVAPLPRAAVGATSTAPARDPALFIGEPRLWQDRAAQINAQPPPPPELRLDKTAPAALIGNAVKTPPTLPPAGAIDKTPLPGKLPAEAEHAGTGRNP